MVTVLGDDLAAGVVHQYRDLPWTYLTLYNLVLLKFFSYSDYIGLFAEVVVDR